MADETDRHLSSDSDESEGSVTAENEDLTPAGDGADADDPVLPTFDRPEVREGVRTGAVSDPVERFDSPGANGTVDRRIPGFDQPARHPATEAPRSAVESTVLPRFEHDAADSGTGQLLGAAARGSVRSEPAQEAADEITPYEPSGFGIAGPEYDEEMPLTEHIDEMLRRLAVVIVVAGAVSLAAFPFADQVINFLWFSILPSGELTQPRIYGPLELFLTRIKVASLVGLIAALPILVYETYAFMRPGLYPQERRYYLAAVPTSLILALVGVAFAYFIVLPAIFTYFLFYSTDAGSIAFALGQTFDLILILMAYLAIIFQIPLLIMLAVMMGVVTRRWLADKRLYFWGAFLGLAFISSPDPTGMAPILIALTMLVLFEGTLLLLKWVDRGRNVRSGG